MSNKDTPGPWAAKDGNGKFLDADGWYASHDGNEDTCFVPIHKHGKVVALIVATGGYFDTEHAVKKHSTEIVRVCNAHDDLVKALQGLIRAGHALSPSSHEWNAAHAAIAKATGANNG